MFRGVEDALLALEHTVIAVLYQQAQHGGAQHPGQHLHLPLFGRQLLAGMESIFQQIAQHHAEVGLRDGQLAGQFQPPVHRHAEAVGLVVVVTGQSVHGRIRAEGGALLAQLGFVLVQVVFQLIHLPGLGESGDDVEVLEEAEAFYQRLSQCKNVRQPVNVVSHFARADEPTCGATERQLDIFTTFTEGKPGLRSIAASGGILLWPQSHYDWVRPGIILYGVSPLDDRSTGRDFGCQPVMTLTSSLIAVREHKAGEPVGYGGTWISERDTRLGVVAMGYGDGYPRAAPSGTPVLVNGREVPIVGRVAMDMICVDLGPQAQDKAGDAVVLWGEGLPVERIAEITKVSAYELITRLTSRVAMKYFD